VFIQHRRLVDLVGHVYPKICVILAGLENGLYIPVISETIVKKNNELHFQKNALFSLVSD